MTALDEEQRKRFDSYFKSRTLKCPMCEAGRDDITVNGITKLRIEPLPNGQHAVATQPAVHLSCNKCSYVILFDARTINMKTY